MVDGNSVTHLMWPIGSDRRLPRQSWFYVMLVCLGSGLKESWNGDAWPAPQLVQPTTCPLAF